METMFYVQMEGIHPRGVVAARSTLQQAINAACQFAEAQEDNYHAFAVYPIDVDAPINVLQSRFGIQAPAGDCLFKTTKNTSPNDTRT